MRFRIFVFCTLLLIIGGSCKKNRLKINVSNIDIDIKVNRFDTNLFKIPTENFETNITDLRNEGSDFFDLFTYRMIKIGGIGDDMFFNELKRFVTDTMIQNVNYLVQEEFGDFSKTEKKINKAFRHYKYYFPQKEIPTIYTCVSGFNQSIVIADKLIGISLDKYLGNNCHYYDMLGIPKYKQQKMYHNKITSDIIHGWASTEFTKSNNESNLLSVMIYEGKLLYFLDAMLPQTNDTIKIGYTKEQLLWCKKNEAEMWTNLVENKKLYASARMDIKRLIDNSPYTNGFPRESPGRTGVWIGWQIIRSYMEQNKNVSLPQLMESNDSQKILNSSNYFPTKIF